MNVRALALPVALLAACSSRSTPEALARRCADAYGGPEAIRAASSFREEGTVTSILHPGVTGRIGRAYERPGRLRVETQWPDAGGEIRVVDGAAGWRDGKPVSGPALSAMVLQAARLDVTALLCAPGAKLVDRGTWTHEGKTLRVLAVAVGTDLEVEAGIDPGSGRILRTRTTGPGDGRPIEFVTTYSDFRTVGGVLFAFREGNWANGSTTGETVLSRVEVEAPFPQLIFLP